ncbi:uncharacterized protein TNCV_3422571 [Trichonephila clavipes]|nr:uncharacterized protein TNCV_3422571 [Trichonephila clavipes]
MADLPAARVTTCRVFSQVGIDYCGLFQLKTFSGKCRQIRKVYVCVFICFTIKAIHLEIVSDLTTEAFLAALKRFVARRGQPIEIHSDNGRNFVGANNELRKILKALFKEYLNRLQQRPKWCKGNVGFKEGDLVLVKPSENSDSLKWHWARILKLHPGKDNIVRVVTLKGKQGIYKRPVTKIANLPYVN